MTQDIKISVLSDEKRTFSPSKEFSANAHVKSLAEYQQLYDRSVKDPEGFWGEMAEKRLSWFKKWDKVLDYDFHKPSIKWFSGGTRRPGPRTSPTSASPSRWRPKTRSGKIMRRILRLIARGDVNNLGDTSTLLDPAVVDSLVKGKQ